MIKCRLLVGSNAQEVRATVLDMQARVLLDMLGKGIESALINPSALLPDPWQASEEILSNFDMEEMAVEPELTPCIQVCLFTIVNWNYSFLFDGEFIVFSIHTSIYIHTGKIIYFFANIIHHIDKYIYQPIKCVCICNPLIASFLSMSWCCYDSV